MKSLLQIVESLINNDFPINIPMEDLKDRLTMYINNLTDRKELMNIYNSTNNKVDQLSKTLWDATKKKLGFKESGSEFKALFRQIKGILSENGSGDDFDNFIGILKDYNNSESRDYFNNLTVQQFVDYANETPANIFDFFDERIPESYKISKEALKDMSAIKIAKSNTAQGEFELLCNLLLSDTFIKDKKNDKIGRGDIYSEKLAIEFKTDGGRIKDQRIGAGSEIDYGFNEYIKDELRKIKKGESIMDKKTNLSIIGKTVIGKKPKKNGNGYTDIKDDSILVTTKILSSPENFDRSLKDTFEIMCPGIAAGFARQYDGYNESKKLSENEIAKFIKDHIKDLWNGDGFNNENWLRMVGCIQLKFYQLVAGWDYIVVFFEGSKNSNNFGKYISIHKNQLNTLKDIYNNKHIYFDGDIKSADSWNFALHIHAK
jgi:hypothetical protein